MLRRVIAAAVWIAAGAVWVAAQDVVRQADGHVSLHVVARPLGAILRDLGAQRPFERLSLEEAAAAKPVTLNVDNATVRGAVIAVLESAGVNYVLAGGEGTTPM